VPSKTQSLLPGAEYRCQGKEAAIGHLGGPSVAPVNNPIEQRANIGIAFKQENDSLSGQLVDLQQRIRTERMTTQ